MLQPTAWIKAPADDPTAQAANRQPPDVRYCASVPTDGTRDSGKPRAAPTRKAWTPINRRLENKRGDGEEVKTTGIGAPRAWQLPLTVKTEEPSRAELAAQIQLMMAVCLVEDHSERIGEREKERKQHLIMVPDRPQE